MGVESYSTIYERARHAVDEGFKRLSIDESLSGFIKEALKSPILSPGAKMELKLFTMKHAFDNNRSV